MPSRSLSSLFLFFFALLFFALAFCAAPASAQWIPLNPVKEAQLQPDGALFALQTGYLRFQINSDSIVHVVYSLEQEVPQRQDFLVINKTWPKADFSLHTEDAKVITLSTSQLKIEVNRAD